MDLNGFYKILSMKMKTSSIIIALLLFSTLAGYLAYNVVTSYDRMTASYNKRVTTLELAVDDAYKQGFIDCMNKKYTLLLSKDSTLTVIETKKKK
jgi:hypothetical protein